jgi:hypothetical protein
MTNKDFSRSVAKYAKLAMKRKQLRYVDIEINYSLPYISVGMNGSEFFAQGDSAKAVISQAVEMGNKTQLAISTCLIYLLDSAGVL